MNVFADIEAIAALRDALRVFAGRQTDARDAMQDEIEDTQAMLDEAEAEARDAVEQCADRLAECYRAAAYTAEMGDWADCSGPEYRLRLAEERLTHILRWQQRVASAISAYQAAADRFAGSLAEDLPRATSYLADRITALEAYYAGQLAAGAPALAATGSLGLMGAVIGAIRACASGLSRTIGNVGEGLAAQVLSAKFGLEEVPFDRSWHGFDRVFRAPGIPLIVVEAKVRSGGALRLGQTQAGEQGSAEWLAAQADRMTDRDSAQWSPANERIGRVVQTLGAENVPVATVVVDPLSGRSDVYIRQGDSSWQLASGDIDLAQLDRAGPRQPSAPAERKEGGPGGPEQRG